MTDINLFFKENAKESKTVKYAPSKRFEDETGKPLEWTLKTISTEKNEEISKECERVVKSRTGVERYQDNAMYGRLLVAECVVEPNLHREDLQNSWNAMCAEEVPIKMLEAGEYLNLLKKITEINNFDSYEEIIEDMGN